MALVLGYEGYKCLSLHCREYCEVILTVCLLYNNGHTMKEQFHPVKMRYDVEL